MSRAFGSIAIKVAALVLFILLLGIGMMGYFSYEEAKSIFRRSNLKLLQSDVKELESGMKSAFKEVLKSSDFLSQYEGLKGFLRAYYDPYGYDERTNKTFSQYKEQSERIFTMFLKQNPAIFQIRLLDQTGMEIVKGIKQDGAIYFAENEALQNKGHRDYFQEIAKLKEGFYLSKIDLNKEFHTIEYPLKPTIRIGSIIQEHGRRLYLFVNVDVAKLWNFANLTSYKDKRYFIADEEGYYIFNPKEPFKEFGFEFGKEYKISQDMPYVDLLYKDKKFLTWQRGDRILVAKRFSYYPGHSLVLVGEQSITAFNQELQAYNEKLLGFIAGVSVLLALLTALFVYFLTRPIRELTSAAKEIARTKGEKSMQIEVRGSDEIAELARSIKQMMQSLVDAKKRVQNFAKALEVEVEKKTKELKRINENLQQMVKEQVEQIRQKDHALAQQAKMAAMGEMLGAIAHQWRQPLNDLAINIQFLEDLYEAGKLDQEQIEHFVDKNMQTIKFMSDTIDDFRNFFRKDKEIVEFRLADAAKNVLRLQQAQLRNHDIEVSIEGDARLKGYKNEFMQALLNLISNAKDAIEHRREREKRDLKGRITIQIEPREKGAVVRVKDNGGGIPEKIRERLFEPYFTTKEEGKGTGMGLWMVNEIVNHFHGSIRAYNEGDGAVFEMELRSVDES